MNGPRIGSTWLMGLLNQHTDLSVDGEHYICQTGPFADPHNLPLFNWRGYVHDPAKNPNCEGAVDRYHRHYGEHGIMNEKTVRGSKIKATDLAPRLRKEMEDCGTRKFICLERTNTLLWAIAMVRGVALEHRCGGHVATKKCTVPPTNISVVQLVESVRQARLGTHLYRSMCEHVERSGEGQVLYIDYESLLSTRDRVLKEIFAFLNVNASRMPQRSSKTKMIKTTRSVSHSVPNYFELERLWNSTLRDFSGPFNNETVWQDGLRRNGLDMNSAYGSPDAFLRL